LAKPKENVTITVDPDVLKKAKSLGVNLSRTTELALRGFTFKSIKADESEVCKAYDQFFEAMTPLLRKYGAQMKIAEFDTDAEVPETDLDKDDHEIQSWWLSAHPAPPPNDLSSYIIFDAEEEGSEAKLDDELLQVILSPEELLTNFIEALAGAAERNGKHIQELALYGRVITALSEPQT
jgi:hypothetical protein